MSSPLHDKTVRPGSLNGGYYYYASNRQPSTPQATPPKAKKSHRKLIFVLVLALGIGGWYFIANGNNTEQKAVVTQQKSLKTSAALVMPAKNVNYCKDNSLDKYIRISVDLRHLWACEGSKTVYNTVVITGLRGHLETETPVGTYRIYGKMTNTTLTGSDSRGTWKDPVYYWMPFLDNQYGTYGFHDATWRPDSAFGRVSPDSKDASHGCVELPLEASKWLYGWAEVGTTVTVES